MRRSKDLQAEVADLILEILETADGSQAIERTARSEGISKNQFLAAAIARAIWELLDREVFGTE